jgi:quercetin dioxygenase-like cupin family protein
VFFKRQDIPVDTMLPGVSRRIMAHESKLMMVEVYFDAGAVVPAHAHPHEQASYVVSGKVRVNVGGKEAVCEAGDSFFSKSGVEHSVAAFERSVVVDVFTPQREDFLKK